MVLVHGSGNYGNDIHSCELSVATVVQLRAFMKNKLAFMERGRYSIKGEIAVIQFQSKYPDMKYYDWLFCSRDKSFANEILT